MAEPKKKLSKTRTNRRRAQYKAVAKSFVVCANCSKPILPHQVCRYCGFYKGSAVKVTATKQRIITSAEDSKEG